MQTHLDLNEALDLKEESENAVDNESKYSGYFQALLWACTSCGHVLDGGQPKMECEICEAYKTSYIDIPQDLEATVRQEFPDLPPGHVKCRERRLELMKAGDIGRKSHVAGRVLPTQSGNHIDPSEFDV
jgi:rubredoxin